MGRKQAATSSTQKSSRSGRKVKRSELLRQISQGQVQENADRAAMQRAALIAADRERKVRKHRKQNLSRKLITDSQRKRDLAADGSAAENEDKILAEASTILMEAGENLILSLETETASTGSSALPAEQLLSRQGPVFAGSSSLPAVELQSRHCIPPSAQSARELSSAQPVVKVNSNTLEEMDTSNAQARLLFNNTPAPAQHPTQDLLSMLCEQWRPTHLAQDVKNQQQLAFQQQHQQQAQLGHSQQQSQPAMTVQHQLHQQQQQLMLQQQQQQQLRLLQQRHQQHQQLSNIAAGEESNLHESKDHLSTPAKRKSTWYNTEDEDFPSADESGEEAALAVQGKEQNDLHEWAEDRTARWKQGLESGEDYEPTTRLTTSESESDSESEFNQPSLGTSDHDNP